MRIQSDLLLESSAGSFGFGLDGSEGSSVVKESEVLQHSKVDEASTQVMNGFIQQIQGAISHYASCIYILLPVVVRECNQSSKLQIS